MSANKKSIAMVVDHSNMSIYPKNLEDFKYLLTFFEDRSDVTVTIEPLIRKVEQSQMGLLHVYIKYIHEFTGDDQKDIKIDMKQRYGVRMDDGSLKSTSNYTTTEMNKLIEGTFIFMTQFLGINVPTPDEWRTKNMK